MIWKAVWMYILIEGVVCDDGTGVRLHPDFPEKSDFPEFPDSPGSTNGDVDDSEDYVDEFKEMPGVETFKATNEWQPIREGQRVPPGLHYRMNLATGEKEAKLLEPEKIKFKEAKKEKMLASIQEALKNLPDDGVSDMLICCHIRILYYT